MSVLREQFKKDVPDFDVSAFSTERINELYESERSRWTEVYPPEPGDVAMMRIDTDRPDMAQHVGVYVGNGRILHTLRKRESHLVRIDDPYWSKKIVGWYRWMK